MTKTTSNIVIGTTLLLAIGAMAGHLLGEPFIKLLQFDRALEEQQVVQLPQDLVSGSLLASLRPNGVEGGTAGIYKMNVATGEVSLEDDSNDFYAPTLSRDGSRVAVVGNDGDDIGLLFVADITQPDDAVAYAPPAPALWAGVASWSSDDAYVAYEALGATMNATDTAITNSYVVILDVSSGDQRILDSGASPIFAPDDSVVYLKSDGIYRSRLSEGETSSDTERLAFFDGYTATRNSQLALTPDGSLIVVTHPESSLLLSYAVNGVDGIIELSAPTVRETAVAWPVFSPDSTHLAYVTLNITGDEATADSLIVVNRATGETRTVMSLEGYDDVNLSIRDWIE